MTTAILPYQQQLALAQSKMTGIMPEQKVLIELGFARQLFIASDKLQKCNPESILNSVVNVARVGITLNPALKLAYLIPRKGSCVLDISYMGQREILIRSGAVRSLQAYLVYEGEEFEVEYGTDAKIVHRPLIKGITTPEQAKKRNAIAAYSVATLADGSKSFEVMNMGEILAIKAKASESKDSEYSPWNIPAYESEMIKKTVLRRHYKSLPKLELSESARLMFEVDAEASEYDHEFNERRRSRSSDKKTMWTEDFAEAQKPDTYMTTEQRITIEGFLENPKMDSETKDNIKSSLETLTYEGAEKTIEHLSKLEK